MVRQRDQDIRFLRGFINTLNANLHVAQLGRVYRTNEDNSLVDIQPLALNSSGTKRAPLINVPVGLVARQYIKEGAVVLVQFLAVVSEVMWVEGH